MPDPVHIAAIDAGSNAVRLLVVRAFSALDIEPLHNERYPLRLGESVFVRNRFSEDVFKKAAKAFSHFRDVISDNIIGKPPFIPTRMLLICDKRMTPRHKLQAVQPFNASKTGINVTGDQ